jgi:hypothetical protein
MELETFKLTVALVLGFALTAVFNPLQILLRNFNTYKQHNMADAADGKMKDLKISETKKSKKDGAPKTAAKKPQQQKKKVGRSRNTRVGRCVDPSAD